MKLDQYQLGLKRIKVAISNPPKRAANITEGEVRTSEGVGGREDSEGFRKPSFIPPQARPTSRWCQEQLLGRLSQPLLINSKQQELVQVTLVAVVEKLP